jgi:hypothetical protein
LYEMLECGANIDWKELVMSNFVIVSVIYYKPYCTHMIAFRSFV